MKSRNRTFLGAILFIPMAIVMLVTFACLPAPVGDPDKAKVDEAFLGAWKAMPGNPAEVNQPTVTLIRQWDAHTYYIQYMMTDKKEDKETRQIMNVKAWLTNIGGVDFLTCQTMDDLKMVAGDEGRPPMWMVFRMEKTPAGFTARAVSNEPEWIKSLTKREEIEAAIKAHLEDKALYGEPLIFKKLGKEDQPMLEEMQGKFNIK